MRPAGEANSLAREIQGAAASSEIIAAAASSEFRGAATSSEIKSAATIAPRGDGRRVELRCPQKAALRAPDADDIKQNIVKEKETIPNFQNFMFFIPT